MIDDDRELKIAEHDGMAMVSLNRPNALNALTLEMIRILAAGLVRWEDNHKIKAVLITGAGNRAFCAGGDIKAAYAAGMNYRRGETDDAIIALYYGEEYQMNRRLFHYRKPLIAFMDGITMGGGFGVAGPCRFRVATEKTSFAMPEVGIGFFPDVGSAYFLNSCPGHIGTYLALTGNTVSAEDALYAGLATHYIPSGRLSECEDELCQALAHVKDEFVAFEMIAEVLERFSVVPEKTGMLQENRELIEECFGHDSVMGILEALRWDDSAWAHEAAASIFARSPVSVMVTLEHLLRARGQDFDSIITRDFALAQHFLKGHDFYEGVRAAVIDKDRKPQWEPRRLEDVSGRDIALYFSAASRHLDEFGV